MKILGISGLYHDSAASVVNRNEILAAVQEERFSRIKNDRSWPTQSISFCLEKAGGDIDYIAFYEDPVLTFDRVFKSMLQTHPQGLEVHRNALVRQLQEKSGIGRLMQDLVQEPEKRFFVKHHHSHAASAFFPSALKRSAILVVDSVGEWATTSIFLGEGEKIKLLQEINYPHSLGLIYSAITYFCGFKVNSGEYKLMGLAPFGRPLYKELIYDQLIQVNEDGSYKLNLEYFGFHYSELITNKLFDDLFKMNHRIPESKITQGHADVAASIQAVLEETMVKLSRHAMQITDSANLCLAGGVALNCVANSRVRELLRPKSMWIQPAAGDAGGAIGSALYVRHNILGIKRELHAADTDCQSGSFLGPSFSDEDVKKVLDQNEVKYHLIGERKEHHLAVVEEILEGRIVGRFFGSLEFGPRALGARSILADPRNTEAQKYVNLKIKYRESWRPFAPAVLSHKKHLWFENGDESPFMLFTSKVLQNQFHQNENKENSEVDLIDQLYHVASRSKISAVTHVDGSSRVQTVDIDRNEDFHGLISEFDSLTNCPILLNTSFNVRGEPLVCSPQDALNCFFATDMDALSIQNYLILKREQEPKIPSDKRHKDEFA